MLDQAQIAPKHLFSQTAAIKREEKLKWLLSDARRKAAAHVLAGVIFFNFLFIRYKYFRDYLN